MMPPSETKPRKFIIVDGSTVRERTRDSEEEATDVRPKKRQRIDDDDDEQEVKPSVVRDLEYYKEDVPLSGLIVVQVENILFKAHRNLLYASSTMKEHCVRLVTSDNDPVVLTAATADEFRALLWALYTAPHEVNVEDHSIEEKEVNRLLNICSISKTYQYTSLHAWTIKVLNKIATNKIFTDSCSSAMLTRLVDLAASEPSHKSMLTLLVQRWIDRIRNSSIASVPAMLAADRHNLSELRGISYYVHVQDMIDRQTNTATGATQLRTDEKLGNGQVMRVLSGYWSLVSFWEDVRKKPLEVQCADACNKEAHAKCVATWEKRWSSAVGWKRILGHNSADVLALLACLRDQLSGDDELREGMAPACRLASLKALKDKLEHTREHLADHFFGCV